MTIQEFADRYRVRVRRDGCGDDIITGFQSAKDLPQRVDYRSHIYDHGDGRFGVCLLFSTSKRNTYTLARLVKAGFTVGQVGHSESTALFDPANEQQARLAMAECQINQRRKDWKGPQEQPVPPLVATMAA